MKMLLPKNSLSELINSTANTLNSKELFLLRMLRSLLIKVFGFSIYIDKYEATNQYLDDKVHDLATLNELL